MNYVTKAVTEIADHIEWINRNHIDKNFQQGDCFLFHKILKTSYPEARPFYEPVSGHVYTLLLDRLWDSKGQYMYPMDSEPSLIKKAESWKS